MLAAILKKQAGLSSQAQGLDVNSVQRPIVLSMTLRPLSLVRTLESTMSLFS